MHVSVRVYEGLWDAPVFALGDVVSWVLIVGARDPLSKVPGCGHSLRMVRRIEQQHEFPIGEYVVDEERAHDSATGTSGPVVAYGGQPEPPATYDDPWLVQEQHGRYVEVEDPRPTTGRVVAMRQVRERYVQGPRGFWEPVSGTERFEAVTSIDLRAIREHLDLPPGPSGQRVSGWLVELDVTQT